MFSCFRIEIVAPYDIKERGLDFSPAFMLFFCVLSLICETLVGCYIDPPYLFAFSGPAGETSPEVLPGLVFYTDISWPLNQVGRSKPVLEYLSIFIR